MELFKKPFACVLLIFAVFLFQNPAAALEESENLIYNGDFSRIDEDGIPEGWYTEAYLEDKGYSVFQVETSETEGIKHAAFIQNIALNDARFAQVVEVEPDTLYRVSADIRAEGIEEGHGANLSIEGIYAFSEELFDTDGEWQHIDWYGVTGPDQEDVTLFVRLGGYSGESKGKAWFANLEMVRAEGISGDAVADRWYQEDSGAARFEDETEDEIEEPSAAWPFLLLVAVLYSFATGLIFFRIKETNLQPLPVKRAGSESRFLLMMLGTAFLLRMVLSWFVKGYEVDVNCFRSWGNTMVAVGPLHFYQQTGFCDYPPAYTYVMGLSHWLSRLLGGSEACSRVAFRFVPALCDVTAAWLIYKKLSDGRSGYHRLEAAFALLIAFNPAVILNSAGWGQIDSVLCLLLLIVAIEAIRENWKTALPVYMLSVLVKPQALMLGFLGLAAVIYTWLKKPVQRKSILTGLGISAVVLLVIVIPFSIGQDPAWIINLYSKTLSSYPYATVNTANFYYLLGGNWNGIDEQAHMMAPVLLCAFSVLWGWLSFRCNGKGARFRWLESSLSAAFSLCMIVFAAAGMSWGYVGTASMVFAFAIALSVFLRRYDIRFLPYSGALLFILLYVFGVKMHERYIFPAVFLLGASWMVYHDRRIIWLLTLLSAALFVNEGIILDNSIRLGSSLGHLNQDTVWLADLLSIVNILCGFYAVWIGSDLSKGRIFSGKQPSFSFLPARRVQASRSPFDFRTDSRLHWNRKDTVFLTMMVLIYSAVTLSTLGSTKAPQTPWTSSEYNESVILDLGKYDGKAQMLYFAQVSRYDFSVAESDDLRDWSEEIYAQMDQGQCWRWKYVTESVEGDEEKRIYYNSDLSDVIGFTGRYLRITAHQIGLTLNEILIRDETGRILPVRIVERTGGEPESELYSDPAALIDEQDLLEGMPAFFGSEGHTVPQPSWWNGTYFDEIYHARTGFEMLHGTVPYETTHPPLGKVFMSLCISVFGMTPFGWRFAGALAGILMLPCMYLLGKQLTKRTLPAVLSCGLMMLDCMHLTQTQIATIDSFPVLFILAAYFFMLRFMQTNIILEKRRFLLINLGLSGFFMGLSIASKWIGIYAGAGLGVLFFWHCFRHIRLCRIAEKIICSGESLNKETRESLSPWLKQKGSSASPAVRITVLLCAWCLIFFVLVPLIIYLLSYLPYFAYNRNIHTFGEYIDAVWKAQTGMLNYHSLKGLGMDHPFYSPWWEWPIIGKPMYYASAQYMKDNNVQYSIFCFGNPIIWYLGLLALAVSVLTWFRSKRYQIGESAESWHLFSADFDNSHAFLLIGLLAQYLPWMLVPRGTYIYHYFASIPFLMLMIVLSANCFCRKNRTAGRIITALILISALAGFIILFPYASGIAVPTGWLDIGRSLLKIWY